MQGCCYSAVCYADLLYITLSSDKLKVLQKQSTRHQTDTYVNADD